MRFQVETAALDASPVPPVRSPSAGRYGYEPSIVAPSSWNTATRDSDGKGSRTAVGEPVAPPVQWGANPPVPLARAAQIPSQDVVQQKASTAHTARAQSEQPSTSRAPVTLGACWQLAESAVVTSS